MSETKNATEAQETGFETVDEITDEQVLALALGVIERQHQLLVENGIDPYTGKKLTT